MPSRSACTARPAPSDGNVTLEAGQEDEYTMLDRVSIEPM